MLVKENEIMLKTAESMTQLKAARFIREIQNVMLWVCYHNNFSEADNFSFYFVEEGKNRIQFFRQTKVLNKTSDLLIKLMMVNCLSVGVFDSI